MRQTLNLSNIQLSYLEWNRGKEPLIVLHGLADCGLVWSSLAETLSTTHHIIAPDLRGHGNSSKPETGYLFADFIADLEGLMAALGWSSAHFLAHSWSAKILTLWAAQQPDRFRSLTLVDPFFIDRIPSAFEITFPILYRVLPFLKTMQSFASYAEAEAVARQLKQYRGWTALQQQVFQESIEQKSDRTWSSKFTVAARNAIFAEVMKVAGLTKVIDIPTLLVKPEQGLNRTKWQLKPYKTYLKNLQIREVPGNHWAFLVEPEAFNKTVKEFLLSQQIKQ
jgi:pimeloyl-ACP methyl ester carboxylesterase